MSFSQCAGTSIIPTLARLVLALAFISVGYNKLFKKADFSAEEATILQKHGISVSPPAEPQEETEGVQLVLASLQPPPADEPETPPADEPTPPPADEEPAETTPEEDPDTGLISEPLDVPELDEVPSALEPADDPAEAPAPADVAPAEAGRALSLFKITVLMDKGGITDTTLCTYGAWLAAVTEFAGGILLLLGLLSRLWGLGLAFAMGMAVYLTTWDAVTSTRPDLFAENLGDYNRLFAQLGLGLLAFGIFLTGPGPLSLDRLIGGPPKKKEQPVVEQRPQTVQSYSAPRPAAPPPAQTPPPPPASPPPAPDESAKTNRPL